MNSITKQDKEKILDMFFNRAYGIDDLAHKFRKKYERPQIRSCIFNEIERG